MAAGVGLGACTPSPEAPVDKQLESEVSSSWREIDSPAGVSSFAPGLEVATGELVLSWLEQTQNEAGETYHQLLVSRLQPIGWTKPAWVASGSDFFANWADTPSVAAAEDGTLFAHWLAKTDEDTYAYSIYLARSEDGGASWAPLGQLNDDDTPTEHGFVSYVPEGEGIRAFWLDGRRMVDGGDMSLRTARVGARVGAPESLDDRVCECCSTAATLTEHGPIAVFRDRSSEEIRDIGVVRCEAGAWTTTVLVSADQWRIEGCPVNGPEVAASGERVAVVWYTAGGETPQVRVALSRDAGKTFEPSQRIDAGRPMGRVDIVEDGEGGFIASWLEGADEQAEISLLRITDSGPVGSPIVVGRTSPSRASGFPRLARVADDLYLAWVDITGEDASRVRVLEIPVSAVA